MSLSAYRELQRDSEPSVADNTPVEYNNDHAILATHATYERHRLVGRRTRVLPMTVSTSSPQNQTEAIQKLSWVDQSRVPQAELRVIPHARERAKRNVEVVNHRGMVVTLTGDHASCSTATIRDALGLRPNARVAQSFVSHKLRQIVPPVQDDGQTFLKAFFEVEQCTP